LEQDYATSIIKKLYHEHSDGIFRFIFFTVGDIQLAEDLTHDTFLSAFKSIDNFAGRSTEKTWLYCIARNITLDFIRKKKTIKWILESLHPGLSSSDPLPQEILILGESEDELYQALNKLKRQYRMVIYFRKIKEFSISETAHILGWKESKVKTNLNRGLHALKIQLAKEGYAHEPV
jgi:RNA polymerase sigma-70 factor (ECF subfamily)